MSDALDSSWCSNRNAFQADGAEGGDRQGQLAAELASLVRPSNRKAPVRETVWDDIWEKVVRDGARLPGNWDDTLEGALTAARSSDWTLCAYLAARCFEREGTDALVAPERSSSYRKLWREVVAPVVVDIPAGTERLRVNVGGPVEGEWVPTDRIRGPISSDGHVQVKGVGRGTLVNGPSESAEHFNVGAILQVTKLKRVVLEPTQVDELYDMLFSQAEDFSDEPRFRLARDAKLAQLHGAWYQVMAYPLGGDLSKAMLRRVASGWSVAQHQTMWQCGETLLSQCAKASQWGLVKTLIQKAKVPIPDISHEFEELFGDSEVLRRQWRKDLFTSFGCGRTPSLVELAAWDTHSDPESCPLQTLVQAMPPQRQRSVLGSGAHRRQTPLIVAAALKGRWDVVSQLLDLDKGIQVGATTLLRAEIAPLAPPAIYGRLEQRARDEETTTVRALNLREYFLRQLKGEPPSELMAPRGFKYDDNCLDTDDMRVVNRLMWLGNRDSPSEQWEVAFVRLSPDEYDSTINLLYEEFTAPPVLPFDLTMRHVEPFDPEEEDWLAVCCPRSYFNTEEDPYRPTFQIPLNCIPTPHIGRLVTVEVQVVTPCCKRPLGRIPVFINGKAVGDTSEYTNKVKVRLAPGSYIATAPEYASQSEPFKVDADDDFVSVLIQAKGQVYVFLKDLSTEDDQKDGVYVTTERPTVVSDDVRSFFGHVTLPGKKWLCDSFGKFGSSQTPVFRVKPGKPCAPMLAKLSVDNRDGRVFRRDTEYEPRCNELHAQGDCIVANLTSVPSKLGILRGPQPTAAPPGALQPFLPMPGKKAPKPSGVKGARRPVSASGRRAYAQYAKSSCEEPSQTSSASSMRPASASSSRGRRKIGAARKLDHSLLEIWRSL